MNDDRLRAELQALERSAPSNAAPARVTLQPVWTRSVLISATVVAAVAVTWFAFALSGSFHVGRPSPSANPPAIGEMRVGDFVLTISSPKSVWTTEEAIEVGASLKYVGVEPNMTISQGKPPIGFTLAAASGDGPTLVGNQLQSCVKYPLSAAEPILEAFSKGAPVNEDGIPVDAIAPFDQAFRDDPELHLPAGEWKFTALTRFDERGCGDDHVLQVSIVLQVVPNEAMASPSPSAAPRTSVSPLASDIAWRIVPFPDRSAAIDYVSVVGTRVFVTGREGSEAAAWLSDDQGRTWRQATVEQPTERHVGADMAHIAAGPGRLVAEGEMRLERTSTRTVAWISNDDGLTWELSEDPSTPQLITDVTGGPAGFVAVGADEQGATTCMSPDGLTWARHPLGVTGPRPPSSVAMWRGGYVVVGESPRRGRPAIWRSMDGTSWEPTYLPRPGWLSDVATSADGILAVGGDRIDLRPTAWWSNDGRTWTAIPLGGSQLLEPLSLALGPGGAWISGLHERLPAPNQPGPIWHLPPEASAGVLQHLDWSAGEIGAVGDSFIAIATCVDVSDCSQAVAIGAP